MKKPQLQKKLGLFAVRTGLEPATSAVTGRHSNQLNYRTVYRTTRAEYPSVLMMQI